MQSALNFSYQIAAARGVKKYDLQLNVLRPCIHLNHSPLPPADAAVIAFTSAPALSASKNIRIDSEITNPFSSLPDAGLDRLFGTSTFAIDSREFLLTDVFATSSDGKAIPLYYKHILPIDAKANSEVNIYDQDFNLVTDQPVLHWRTNIENSFYNNMDSSYNADTGEYNIYYISYMDSAGLQQLKLLNNVPAFKNLTIEDYDTYTTQERFYSFEDKGRFIQVTCLFDFKLYSPTPQGLACRVTRAEYGEILPPVNLNNALPWCPKVTNLDIYYQGYDSITRRYFIPEFADQAFTPYIPYKLNIDVAATIINDHLIKLPDTDLFVDPANGIHLEVIVTESNDLIRYAFTTDTTKVLYSDMHGNITGVRYRTDGFESYDLKDGFIRLMYPIDSTDTVITNYYSNRTDYDYTPLNLNPRFSPAIVEEEAVVFLTPSCPLFSKVVNIFCNDSQDKADAISSFATACFGSNTIREVYSQFTSDFWETSSILIIDAVGISLDTNAIAAALMSGKLVLVNVTQYEDIKTALTLQDTDTITVTTIDGEVSIPYVSYHSGILAQAVPDAGGVGADIIAMTGRGWFDDRWFNDYGWFGVGTIGNLETIWKELLALMVAAYRPFSPTHSLHHIILDRSMNICGTNSPLNLTGMTFEHFLSSYTMAGININQFMVLGHIKVITGGSTVVQVETVDCRVRGGGYKTSVKYSEVLAAAPDAEWCFDQARWDGHPYPGSAAILIELPYTLLAEYGGKFSIKEILSKVSKHLSLGVYPVIRFYGTKDPAITYSHVGTTTIDLEWENLGGPYTVYWGLNIDSLNKAIVTHNNYTITGLKPGFHYIVLVTPVQDNSCVLDQNYLRFAIGS